MTGAGLRVVIVHYRAADWLDRTLQALAAQAADDLEVVVVDNSGELDPGRWPAVQLLQPGRNLGFAAGCNRGAAGARTPWLAFLNPDLLLEPGALARWREGAARHPQAALFGLTQIQAERPDRLDGVGDALSVWGPAWRALHGAPRAQAPDEDHETFAVCGAALLIRRELFEALGGFEPRFFCYLEDVDLCLRARLRGQRCWQIASARGHHLGGVSQGGGRSAFAVYHGARNGIWLLWRDLPLALWPLSLAWPLLLGLRSLLRDPPALRAATWRGLRDGWAAAPRWWWEGRRLPRSLGAAGLARQLSWHPLAPLQRRRHRLD
ncbi:MAG TPA: glycosyltransferase family 2 protein [Nevskiaceae bacterium]|nr:glycosyltransferase family 2 protein [Nevskiaceae bacterium]